MNNKQYVVSVTIQCEVEAKNRDEAEINALEKLNSMLTTEPISEFMTDIAVAEKGGKRNEV